MKTWYRIKVEHDEDPMNPREDWGNPTKMLCWHRRYNLGDENPWKNQEPNDAVLGLISEVNPEFEPALKDWADAEYLRRTKGIGYGKEHQKVLDAITREEREKIAEEFDKHYVSLPLYLYDHGGITMSVGPFCIPWDSGQVGFICISHDEAHKQYGHEEFKGEDKTWSAAKEELVRQCLKNEVKVYDQFLTGDVYGRTIEKFSFEFEIPADAEVDPEDDSLDWKYYDSCWGFFGDDVEESGIDDGVPTFLHAGLKEAQNNLDTWVLVCHDSEEVLA